MRHMKTILTALILALALACPARAETLHIGGTAIEYAVPAGYVLASGEPYALVYENMRAMSADVFELHAVYVPKEADQRTQSSGNADMDRYLVVLHQKSLEKVKCSATDFEAYKKELKKQIASGAAASLADGQTTELRNAIRQAYQESGRGPADWSANVRVLGTYGETPTQLSYLGLVKSELRLADGKVDIDTQALVTSFLLCNGKIIQVVQYKSSRNASDVLALQDEALPVLQSMHFSESPAGGLLAGWKVSTIKTIVQSAQWGLLVIGVILFFSMRAKRKR